MFSEIANRHFVPYQLKAESNRSRHLLYLTRVSPTLRHSRGVFLFQAKRPVKNKLLFALNKQIISLLKNLQCKETRCDLETIGYEVAEDHYCYGLRDCSLSDSLGKVSRFSARQKKKVRKGTSSVTG